jgi:serine phosphatase RsbU (regulator of sigma subunit)/anti-sigma regulatory factor (Ser/Thr protein kinase)
VGYLVVRDAGRNLQSEVPDRRDLAYEAGRAGTWHWDIASGTVVWDDRLAAMYGLPPGGFQRTFDDWVDLIHPDDVDRFVADVHAALAAPKDYDSVHRAIWPDGSPHWIECRGRVTVSDDGVPTGTVGVAFDVTDRKQVEDDLRASREQLATVARTLQESLLGPPVLVEGAGHAARYLPAAARFDVGGDWYNAQRLVDGRIAIAVGDVVGSGLEAATIMGQLRSALSACAYRADTAAEVIETLDLFAESVPGAQAATTVFALVDLVNANVEYSRAGHPPPMLVSPEGDVEVLEGGRGWPLAVRGLRAPRPAATAPFSSGSLLVLYSDGLVERRGESIEKGLQRLQESIGRHWREPLEVFCDSVIADMFIDATQQDDVALIVLRSPVLSDVMILRKVRADASALRDVRAELGRWLARIGMSEPDAEAMQHAVGEACTNAIMHAYEDAANLFRVEASLIDGEIICCVADTGTWREHSELRQGYGLPIIRELMDDLQVVQRSTGTTVVMRRPLHRSP